MRRGVNEFQGEVFEAVRGRGYIDLPPLFLERLISTVKLRFRIRKVPESFVQFYYNEHNEKMSLALIVKGKRIYGHDYTPKRGWHRHSPPNGKHNYSEEGKKPVTVESFMREVDEIIKEARQSAAQ